MKNYLRLSGGLEPNSVVFHSISRLVAVTRARADPAATSGYYEEESCERSCEEKYEEKCAKVETDRKKRVKK